MGTWSVDTYGNDYALDWAQDLQEAGNLEPIARWIGRGPQPSSVG